MQGGMQFTQTTGPVVNTYSQVGPTGYSNGVTMFNGTQVNASKTFNVKGNKVVYLIVGVIGVFLLAMLFGNKTLSCTNENTFGGITLKETTNTKYVLGKFKQMSFEAEYIIEDEDSSYYTVDQMYDNLKDSCDEDDDVKNCKVTKKKDRVIVTGDYTDSFIDGLLDDGEVVKGYSDLKDVFEDHDYTCK